MSERTTGATDKQIEAIARRLHDVATDGEGYDWPCEDCLHQAERAAMHVCPPGARIFDEEDISAVKRVLHDSTYVRGMGLAVATDADRDRLAAKIGGGHA